MDLLAGNLERQLFVLLIDQYNCPNLKSEMEVTRTKVRVNQSDQSKTVVKEKSGDKLPTHRLPRESTNLTDALKYAILRKDTLRAWQRGHNLSASSFI